jgi:hypothetical protein
MNKIVDAVIVVVTNTNGGSPPDISKTRFVSHITKGAVAIVLIKAIRDPDGAPSNFVPLKRKISIQTSLS